MINVITDGRFVPVRLLCKFTYLHGLAPFSPLVFFDFIPARKNGNGFLENRMLEVNKKRGLQSATLSSIIVYKRML